MVTALNLHARYPRFKSVSDLSLLTSDSTPPLTANVFLVSRVRCLQLLHSIYDLIVIHGKGNSNRNLNHQQKRKWCYVSWPVATNFEADVSSGSPLSEPREERWVLCSVCSKERFHAICANVVTRRKRSYKVDVQLHKGKKFEPRGVEHKPGQRCHCSFL